MSAYADLGRIVEKSFQLNRPKLRFREKVDYKYDYGCTALAIAIISGDKKLNIEELKRGADTRSANQWNQTILHLASRHGFLLSELLEADAIKDLNARDEFNQTPLITAARSGSLEVVAKLLEYFPTAHSKSAGTSYNALQWAVLSSNLPIVQALISYDNSSAHLDATGWLGRTPLLDASAIGDSKVLQALLHAGCNPHIRDSEGNGLLHLAGSAATVQCLLSAGFEIDARGAKGRTPVLSALLAQRNNVSSFLIKSGADLTLKDDSGWSVLHYAFQSSSPSLSTLLQVLIQHGADHHAVDNCYCACSPHGCSPTKFALINGRIKTWTEVLEESSLKSLQFSRSISHFRSFEGEGKLHTCCQGSLFVRPYQHRENDDTDIPIPRITEELVYSEDGSVKIKDVEKEEEEDIFHDANEGPVFVESQMDVTLQKKFISMSQAGCQTILLHRGGKRMRVDVQSLVGFRDWEVLLDV